MLFPRRNGFPAFRSVDYVFKSSVNLSGYSYFYAGNGLIFARDQTRPLSLNHYLPKATRPILTIPAYMATAKFTLATTMPDITFDDYAPDSLDDQDLLRSLHFFSLTESHNRQEEPIVLHPQLQKRHSLVNFHWRDQPASSPRYSIGASPESKTHRHSPSRLRLLFAQQCHAASDLQSSGTSISNSSSADWESSAGTERTDSTDSCVSGTGASREARRPIWLTKRHMSAPNLHLQALSRPDKRRSNSHNQLSPMIFPDAIKHLYVFRE